MARRTALLVVIALLAGLTASLPESEAAEPSTVVLALHAGNRTGENLRTNLGWGDRRQGIPVLYPDGEGGHWNSGWEASESTRDDAVLDTKAKSTPPDVLFWPKTAPLSLYTEQLQVILRNAISSFPRRASAPKALLTTLPPSRSDSGRRDTGSLQSKVVTRPTPMLTAMTW